MSYQKCPICDGTGKEPLILMPNKNCSTCNGTKLIHTVTGKPPTLKEESK